MSATLIYGENSFTADQFYNEQIDKFISANNKQAVHIFDGESMSKKELLESTTSQSLFSSGKELIVIKRLGSNSDLKEALVDVVEILPNDTELIIFDPKIDKRSKLYKNLKKSHTTMEFKTLSEYELNGWIAKTVSESGGSVQAGATKLLADRGQGDQLKITNELNKLLNYDKEITIESVKLLVDRNPDDNVFNLLNDIALGDNNAALSRFDELLNAQVEPHYILAMLCWQLSNLLAIKASNDKQDNEISSGLGINPYTLSKAKQTTRRLSMKQLREMSKKAIATDKKIKTTSVDAAQLVRQLIAGL